MKEKIKTRKTGGQTPVKAPVRSSAPGFRRRRKGDIGSWVYNHRAALCVTIIFYLSAGILFVSSKIAFELPRRESVMTVDLRSVAEVMAEKERLEREVQMRQAMQRGGGSVRNLISNEAAGEGSGGGRERSGSRSYYADEGSQLRDDRNTDVVALRTGAQGVDRGMSANREAWERGMREIEAMERGGGSGKSTSDGSDAKVKGRVSVSFLLTNPVRYSVNLIVPAYLCEKAGDVVVNIVVDRRGEVVSAAIDRSLSNSDYCMTTTALDAARGSRFNVDTSAPERQSGSISYSFIAQ